MADNSVGRDEIARRLKEARIQSGLSQGQVAKRMGVHRPTISEIEAGRRRVTAEELDAFARQYGVGFEWLMGRPEQEVRIAEVEIAARQLEKLKAKDRQRVLAFLRSIVSSEGGGK